MQPFRFDLDQEVKLVMSGETGIVIGRAEFRESDSQYQIRYKSADGRQVEGWWTARALVPDEEVQASA